VNGVGFHATHRAPAAGLPTWDTPDPNRPAGPRLEPDLPVRVLEQSTGRARVRCSNGWEAWVDATQLVRLPFRPSRSVPAAGLDARDLPDASRRPDARLDGGLEVEVLEESLGWALVRCSNDWETWVDGRGLVPIPLATASGGSFVAGALVAVALPAAAVVLGSLMAWFSAGGGDANAWDIEVVSLFTHEPTDIDLKTGPVLLVLALVALALIAVPLTRRAATIAFGTLGASVFVLGVAALVFYLDTPEPRPELGVGLLLTVGAGLVLGAAGYLVPTRGGELRQSAPAGF
jgi:hypothetical protein